MNHTTNIPTYFPVRLDYEEEDAVRAWMATRPACEDDHCVNRQARWTYLVSNHGIWTDIVVRDNLDQTTFTVPQNSNNW